MKHDVDDNDNNYDDTFTMTIMTMIIISTVYGDNLHEAETEGDK